MQDILRKILLFMIGLCVAGVIGMAFWLQGKPQDKLRQEEISGLLQGVNQDGPHLGDPDAPVEVVEFIDFQCPACANSIRKDAAKLINDYVRPGQVKWTLAPIALLGKDSKAPALEAYQAAQQNKMFQYVLGYYSKDQAAAIRLSGLDIGKPIQAAALRDFNAATRLSALWKVDATPTILIHSKKGWLRLDNNRFSLDDISAAIKQQ